MLHRPHQCHRRIIADYLIAGHERVFHILGKGHIELASLTAAARAGSHGTLLSRGRGYVSSLPTHEALFGSADLTKGL